jgi:hypothetical protein
MSTRSTRRGRFLLAIALLGGLYGSRATAEEPAPEEKVPLLPGQEEPLTLPTTEQLETLAAKIGKARRPEAFRDAELLVAGLRRYGGAGAKQADGAALTVLACVPEAALDFARRTFHVLPAIWTVDPGTLAGFGERCRLLAMLLERRATVEGETAMAAALARLLHAWTHALAGEHFDTSRVEPSAVVVRSATGPAPVEPAMWQTFVHALSLPAAACPRLGAWLDAEIARLADANVGEKPMRLLNLARALGKAIRSADMEEKGAAALLAGLLPPLEPADALPQGDPTLAGLYNRAVTRARLVKAPVKSPYRTSRQRASSGILEFDLPVGTGWTHVPGDSDQDEGAWIRDEGIRERATLQVWKYSTSTDYVDDEGKVIGGDNVGGRLKSYFESDKASLRKVQRATMAVGRLSKGVPDSRGYEVRGDGGSGLMRWYREWYYKSDVRRSVINISLRREGIVLDPDPELDAILDSMTEAGARR